mmetsp:Transcript_2310/g.6028  ORF Transcript_2310/g.6028 Transcript_2310/m.6028 type:complete len:487 (-) Transcript_2310:161-1621(-)
MPFGMTMSKKQKRRPPLPAPSSLPPFLIVIVVFVSTPIPPSPLPPCPLPDRSEHFIRGQPHLCLKMKRCKIKGTAKRRKKVPADHDADAGLQQTQKQTKQQPVAAKKCAPPAATAMPKLALEHDGLASPAPSEKDLIATLASSSNGNPPQHFSTNDFSLLQSLWTSQEMGNLAPAQPPTVPVAAVAGAVNGGNNNASSNSMINGLSGTTSPMFMARQQQQQQQTGTAENVILSSFLDDDLMLKGSRNFDDIGFDMSSESSMMDTMLRNSDTFSSSPSDLNAADAMMNNAPRPSQEISQAAPAPAAAPVASYVNSNNNAGAPGACQQLSVESMAQQLYMPRTSQAIAAAYSSLNNLNFLQQQQQQQQQQNAGFFSSNQFCGGAGAHAMPSLHNTAAIETALASISQGAVAAAAAFVPTVAASQQAPTTQSPPSASAPSPSFLSGNSQPAAAKPQFSISETLDMLLRSSPKNDNAFEHDGEFVVSEEV